MSELSFGKYIVALSNEDKLLFPKSGITKRQVVDHYSNIAEFMVPVIRERPLTLKRYPNGIMEVGFFQKNVPDHFPDWIEATEVPRKNKDNICMVVGNNAATLAYLANQNTITFHSWLSRKDMKEQPDRLIFDLDPSGNDFAIVKEAAYILKEYLEDELELQTFVMLTGSKGMHIIVPIAREHHFDEVKAFAKNIGEYISLKYPDRFTIEHRKAKRKGRLYVDYLRNEFAQTGIAPYSLRAIEGAPVATPIDWEEVGDKKLVSQRYDINTVWKRLEGKGDPWENINRYGKSISRAMKQVEENIIEAR